MESEAMDATYEVEMKFRVRGFEAIERELKKRNAIEHGLVEESDTYFNHPQRNFAETDEALRIRTSSAGACITYKGRKLDQTTKTRQEIEVPLGTKDAAPEDCGKILLALGFRPVGTVRKKRRRYSLPHDEYGIEITLDEVLSVGTFVELEICTDAAGMETAKTRVLELAKSLGLSDDERRSYLHLLLVSQAAQSIT